MFLICFSVQFVPLIKARQIFLYDAYYIDLFYNKFIVELRNFIKIELNIKANTKSYRFDHILIEKEKQFMFIGF